MNPKQIFTATKLPMLGKKGLIKPDENGYYELVVGGLNTHNNTKSWYYTLEGCRELFGPGSLLHRRVANGSLRAEVNHPRQMPGERDEAFMSRMLDIDMNNVCAHFSKIWLDENFGKNHPEYGNPNLIAIMALVKPVPPKGDILKEALENSQQNICFSIRALASQGYVGREVIRQLTEVITIDLVNEGGILVASKWDSPATEGINNRAFDLVETMRAMRVTEDTLKRISEESRVGCATESSREAASFLLSHHFQPKTAPLYSRW